MQIDVFVDLFMYSAQGRCTQVTFATPAPSTITITLSLHLHPAPDCYTNVVAPQDISPCRTRSRTVGCLGSSKFRSLGTSLTPLCHWERCVSSRPAMVAARRRVSVVSGEAKFGFRFQCVCVCVCVCVGGSSLLLCNKIENEIWY